MNIGPRHASRWGELFQEALSIIDQANAEFDVVGRWTFGGGTALMLQISHRESHDVDLFINDPQLLGFLAPHEGRFTLSHTPKGYAIEGTHALKISFDHGEIDFICAPQLTEAPTRPIPLFEREIQIETPAEILAKKIHFRGTRLQPRDIFDIAAVLERCDTAAIVRALAPFADACAAARDVVARMPPDFTRDIMAQLMIREGFETLPDTAQGVTLDFLDEMARQA